MCLSLIFFSWKLLTEKSDCLGAMNYLLKVLSIIYGNKKTQILSYKGRDLRVTTFVLFTDKIR